QREPLRHLPDHRLDAHVVPAGVQRLPGARRGLDDAEGCAAGDCDLDARGHGRRVPARPVAPPVPGGHPDRVHPADHDPGALDRRLPARALHQDVPLAALSRDRGHRAVGVYDAVRDLARRCEAPGLRHDARACRRRPRSQLLPAPATRRAAADPAGDPRRRAVRVHAVVGRVHHHVLPDRRAQHAADLHLHAGEVRDHSGGERRRLDAARRLAAPARAGVHAAAARSPHAARPSSEGRMSVKVATAPVSWGIWEQTIDRPDLIPAETFLETIVDMGYSATETGPPGYFAPDRPAASGRARRYGVERIATFLPLRLDDSGGFEDDLGALDRTVEVLEATGGGIVLLADMETPDRARAAGSEERRRATAWDADTVDRAAERLQRAADIVRARGLDVALHPHAATHVESDDETEAMLARTDVGLCIDTGHSIVGGSDPVALALRHGDRLRHVHLKDVDGDVL